MIAAPVAHVIDDDATFRESLAWMFQTVSIACKTYGTAQEFEEDGCLTSPGCLILDLQLRSETGVEVLRKLRAAGNDVKFGFVTSESTPEMKEQAEAAGALFFIVKPFSAERFDEVFAPILG